MKYTVEVYVNDEPHSSTVVHTMELAVGLVTGLLTSLEVPSTIWIEVEP